MGRNTVPLIGDRLDQRRIAFRNDAADIPNGANPGGCKKVQDPPRADFGTVFGP